MLVNATGQDVEALCSLWGGGIVDWEYIGWSKEKGELKSRGRKAGDSYKILARYMTKEVQPVGARNYSGSKNLARPAVTVRFMNEDEVKKCILAEPQADCEQLDNIEFRNEFGRFWFVSFYNKRWERMGREDRPGLYDGEACVISRRRL